MSDGTARELLLRYLRQRRELGDRDWYLEPGMVASLRALADRPPSAKARGTPTAPSTSKADQEVGVEGGVEGGEEAGDGGGDRGGEEAFAALRSEALSCTRCRLAEGRTTVVFGEGDPHADLLVVGEAPGAREDRSGRPFVGPAGGLLDRMLLAIGFRRSEVFICNVLKCRPPGNRDPLPDEVATCWPYLKRQVELIRPVAICAFGRFAAQTLLRTDSSLGRLRGATHDFMGVPVIATYHPAALLRNKEWKRPAWEDLKLLRRVYDEAGGREPSGENG